MGGVKSIPNMLTGARIALAVVVFGALAAAAHALAGRSTVGAADARAFVTVALAAFAIAAATDYLDGWLARRLNAASPWGAILDPIADKLALLAAVLGLVMIEPEAAIALPGFLMLFREVFVSGLREAGAARNMRLPVTRLAKWKTTVQLVALTVEMLALVTPRAWRLTLPGDALMWLAAALTLWTGGQYALAAGRVLGRR